jgi:hypothetical protein
MDEHSISLYLLDFLFFFRYFGKSEIAFMSETVYCEDLMRILATFFFYLIIFSFIFTVLNKIKLFFKAGFLNSINLTIYNGESRR